MKGFLFIFVCALVGLTAGAQQTIFVVPKPLFPNDPKGLNLPPRMPRMVDTNGNVIWIDEDYTTKQYRDTALKLVIQEANEVAQELLLREQLPISKTNMVEAFIGPFGYNFLRGAVGNVTTKNYTYYMSVNNRFSYLDDMHQNEYFSEYQTLYQWPISEMDTNQAYQLATQWLAAVSMDVKGLNRDCALIIEPYNYFSSPKGKFVPVYLVAWIRRDLLYGDTASVVVFTPTKQLLSLHVEDPRYILRRSIAFTNLDSLMPGPTPHSCDELSTLG